MVQKVDTIKMVESLGNLEAKLVCLVPKVKERMEFKSEYVVLGVAARNPVSPGREYGRQSKEGRTHTGCLQCEQCASGHICRFRQ